MKSKDVKKCFLDKAYTTLQTEKSRSIVLELGRDVFIMFSLKAPNSKIKNKGRSKRKNRDPL